MSEENKLYVFNDTETTGLNTWFSQIIQIGSVLSDENFEVLEDTEYVKHNENAQFHDSKNTNQLRRT